MPSVERRPGAERPVLSSEQADLESIRFLREEIKAFVARHGPDAAAYFERALREWYGPFDLRPKLLTACAEDPGLHAAWRIVHAAGYRAASLLPMLVRHYYGARRIDDRA